MRSTSWPRAVSISTGTRLESAESLENFEAVQAGQHDIQDNQVVAALLRLFERGVAFVDALDGEALALAETPSAASIAPRRRR